ncbi:MAG TPA: long-chain fatty acid--CoA ligase [Oceanithermus profundus]|uniref:Long-chain fatty acid--CoA ligase n=1 Tax=Oceanithermus profundus TaxID=187137 RepID=A0A7C5WQH7_9DEIN|nr:long-chain fatty acid--CoA ligase [Oceanithermus profundus]
MKGTLLEPLFRWAEVRPQAPALRVKRLGVWQPRSWRAWADEVLDLAGGLEALGLGAGGVLAVLGRNAPEWVTAELAAQALGALPLGLYADAMADEVGWFLEYAEAVGVVVADEEQLDKVLPHLERLRFVLVWEEAGMSRYWSDKVRPYSAVAEAGRARREAVRAGLAALTPETVALLAPTSGTTGRSKLAMLSHANLMAGHHALRDVLGLRGDEWLFSYLPLAWIGEQMLTVVQTLALGLLVHFPSEPATLAEDLREVQPDFYLAPPRLWEDAAAFVQSRAQEAGWLKRRTFRWGLDALLEGARRGFRGERVGPGLDLARATAYPLVARPLRGRLGLAATRVAITGGAPLGPEVFTFYRAIGLDIRQVYGQSETAASTCAHPAGDAPPETVGPPLPGTEVKISEEGEILVKGPQVFVGYYKNEEATRETFTPDGWFKSGDAGAFDERGHLIVLGRLKEVGHLADGTRFAPQLLENRLKYSPFIREVVVLGHDRPFVALLVEIDPENVQNWARRRRIPFTTYQSLAGRDEVYELIAREIAAASAQMPEALRPRRFAVLPKELHPDDEEITRTRKVKRNVVEVRYAPLIEGLYGGAERVRLELPIRFEGGEDVLEAEVRIADVL